MKFTGACNEPFLSVEVKYLPGMVNRDEHGIWRRAVKSCRSNEDATAVLFEGEERGFFFPSEGVSGPIDGREKERKSERKSLGEREAASGGARTADCR